MFCLLLRLPVSGGHAEVFETRKDAVLKLSCQRRLAQFGVFVQARCLKNDVHPMLSTMLTSMELRCKHVAEPIDVRSVLREAERRAADIIGSCANFGRVNREQIV